MLRRIYFFLFLQCAICTSAFSQSASVLPLPDGPQLRWQRYEQTMFVHFCPATWQGREKDNHSTPLNRINPELLNTDQWCETAISWGAKMIVFVAKHTGGFCLWQTNTTSYSIKDTPWREGKGDVLKDLSESCRKYGLGLGVYVYPGDDTWGAGIGSGGITSDPSKQEAYNNVFRQQLTEVLTNYGPMQEVWFDGSCKIKVDDILQKYASDAVIFQGPLATIRWVGSEDGSAPFSNWYTLKKEDLMTGISTVAQSDPFGNAYAPVEVDVPLLKNKGHKWFWAPSTDSLILTTGQLMEIYYKSVGRGAVLLLNSTPDTTGLIPASHVAAYGAFGEEINRRFSNPLGSAQGEGKSIEIQFDEPVMVNHAIIQEDIAKGQRVLEFEVSGMNPEGKWITLYKGTSIGHKKICFFDPAFVKTLKIDFMNVKALPQILNFSAFYVDDVTMHPEMKNDMSKFWNGLTKKRDPGTVDQFVSVATLDLSRRWIKVKADITKYLREIGQYELRITSDECKPEFRDWEMELYGTRSRNNVEYLGENTFRITRSQQTLDEFPSVFHVRMRSATGKCAGNIEIRRIKY